MKSEPKPKSTSAPAKTLELALDDPRLRQVRFGRNKMLRLLGAGLAGVATSVAARSPAYAWHGATPTYCYGYGVCHCCSGSNCCASNCVGHSHSHGCHSGGQCWSVSKYVGGGCYNIYRCCDWHEGSHYCICRAYTGRVC